MKKKIIFSSSVKSYILLRLASFILLATVILSRSKFCFFVLFFFCTIKHQNRLKVYWLHVFFCYLQCNGALAFCFKSFLVWFSFFGHSDAITNKEIHLNICTWIVFNKHHGLLRTTHKMKKKNINLTRGHLIE